MPPPNSHGMPYIPKRKEAIASASELETPAEALARVESGGAKPLHYIPTPPLSDSELSRTDNTAFDPYRKSGSK